MSEQTISNLLKQLRKTSGLAANEVAEKLKKYNVDISYRTLYGYESGLSMPNADVFVALCRIYKCDNPMDIFGGFSLNPSETDMIEKYRDLDDHGRKVVDFILEEEHSRSRGNIIPLEQHRNRLVQYYQKFASAGSGQLVFDDVPVDLIEIPDVPEYKDVKYAIGVNGRSMEPLYYDGDILLVKPADDVAVGDIGIFIVDGQSYVKKRGNECLISVNEEYADIPLDESSSCLGEVVDKLST